MKKKKMVNVVVVKQVKNLAVVIKKTVKKRIAAVMVDAFVRGFLKRLKDYLQNHVVSKIKRESLAHSHW